MILWDPSGFVVPVSVFSSLAIHKMKFLAAMYAVWTSPYFIRDEQLAKMRRERAKARAADLR